MLCTYGVAPLADEHQKPKRAHDELDRHVSGVKSRLGAVAADAGDSARAGERFSGSTVAGASKATLAGLTPQNIAVFCLLRPGTCVPHLC
jgi:hypothetical protein